METSINGDSVQIDFISYLRDYIKTKVTAPGREDSDDPFFVADLGRLIELFKEWTAALPTVTPFYAVKCNPDPLVLKTLAALGTGFGCASKVEIRTVLELGVAPDRIIYANPCKQLSHLKYAANKGVDLMTFDNDSELRNIQEHFSSAKLVLRIKADDPHARWQLGAKFGCSLKEGKLLLNTAKSLGLNVVGICFHIGSGSRSPSAYEVALKMAAELFAYGSQIGYQFTMLDIGGGFPEDRKSKELFDKMAIAINKILKTHFNQDTHPGLRVIAEPGQYFAGSAYTLAMNIISKKICEKEGVKQFMYYMNDGTHGSFMYYRLNPNIHVPSFLKECSGPLYSSIVWGPTLNSRDKFGEILLPELEVGDWMYVDTMGAYSLSCSTTFNGFLRTKSYYYVTKDNQDELRELFSPTNHVSVDPSSDNPCDNCGSNEELRSSVEGVYSIASYY